jgi:predicted extracellular nuclease
MHNPHFIHKAALALALTALTALTALPSPALAADTPIYALQGSGSTSPFTGQVVTTTGVVTKRNNNGFFIQDLTGDGNPATSDGIFVFSTLYTPAVGSLVRVAATVVEFNTGAASNADTSSKPLTELSSVSSVTVLGTGYSIAPTVVELPLAAGDGFERFEGMLVRLNGPLTVQQNYFQARYGQLTLGVGRQETVTNRYRPGTPQALSLADEQARSRLLLDDGSSLQNPNPTPYYTSNGVPRAGDTVAGVTGVIDFGLSTSSNADPGLYRIHPTETPTIAVGNPRPALPAAVGGNVRLASMNVLNFFTTFTDGTTASGQTGQGCTLGASTSAGNCRGANNLTEFNRQRAKIVNALAGLNADAVGLMEIQNNGSVAPQNLVDALNAQVGAGTYAIVPDPATGTGTDAIKVAMIYKPARLTRVTASTSDPAAINNRPPLAQTFAAANGERFTLVVNHLKSKSSCPAAGDPDAAGNTDSGDGQGCWNAQRVQQAQQLRSFVAQLQTASGSNDVLLVGDFNAYAQEDPIYNLTSSGYIDQSGRYEALGYSYVFNGTAGRLDHAITTAPMSSKIVGTLHWHIDADEGLAQDYNLEFKQPACSTCAPDPYDGSTPYRASDHDPVLVGLSLYKRVDGTAGRDTLVGSAGDDMITGGGGADTLTGGAGNNIFVYQALRDAGDVITDFVPGKDQLDLRSLLSGLGYTGSDPVGDGWVRFTGMTRTATSVEIDADGPAGPAVFRPLLTLQGVTAANLVPARDLVH